MYGQGNRLSGYLMPFIKQAVPVLVVFNPRRRAETLAQFDRRYLHRAARNLATAIGALHSSGYVIGDLNESNVLVTSSALVTLIDTDSFQVQESRRSKVVTYACPVAKPEYTPPELQGMLLSSTLRSPEQDAFSLGVLIFQLLMEGNHPFRAQWLGKGDPPPIEERIAKGGFPYTSSPGLPVRPPVHSPDFGMLHPEISELLRRCFIDGHRDPHLRPDASAWEWAITEAEKALVQCPKGHFYSDHLQTCPVCHGSSVSNRGAASPSSARRRPAPASFPSGPNTHGWRPNANPAVKTNAVPPAGKPASRQASGAANQTFTNRTSASSAAAAPANAASSGSQPPSSSHPQPPPGPTTSSSRPSGQTSSATSPPGPTGPSTSTSQAGRVTVGVKQVQQAWDTYKFWQSQQTQVQQSSSGTGLGKFRQVQQAKAAWRTWKFWQAQAQQPLKTPSQAAQPVQPPPSRPAQSGPVQGNPGNAQKPNTAAPSAGPGNSQQTQAPGTQNSQVPQNKAGNGSAPGAKPTASPRSQTSRVAPNYAGSKTGRSAYVRSSPLNAQSGNSLLVWAGPRVYKSLAIGGGVGALVGALPGALVGVAGWSAGSMASWVLLWAMGGAAAGLLRGWQPGYRMSLRVDKMVGWQRVMPAIGVVAGAMLGGFIGFALGWWAVIPVFVGLLLGAWLGLKAGGKLWQAGTQLGWERIWAGVGALGAALLGWQLASWLGAGSLSVQLGGAFSEWIASQSASLMLVSLGVGALGGALGGAVSGTLTDLFARLLNLLD